MQLVFPATQYLYGQYALPAAQRQVYDGIIMMPWSLKPVIGVLSDLAMALVCLAETSHKAVPILVLVLLLPHPFLIKTHHYNYHPHCLDSNAHHSKSS